MKKRSIFFITGVLLALNLSAQSIPDLAQINASAKNQFVKVDELDRMQQELKYFDEHPAKGKEQQQTLLDSYRSIANAYSLNNHFKQGYGVYQKYLTLKEGFLSAEKAEILANANSNIEEKQRKDADELISMQSLAQQLQLDNEYLQSKRKSFKHYFTLGIITLTVIFAFLLLQGGLKLNKIKNELKAGRERLMSVHRIAALGKLKTGITLTISQLYASFKKSGDENLKQVEELSRQTDGKNNELAALRKQLNDLNRLAEQGA